jgi:hypothetical protein
MKVIRFLLRAFRIEKKRQSNWRVTDINGFRSFNGCRVIEDYPAVRNG